MLKRKPVACSLYPILWIVEILHLTSYTYTIFKLQTLACAAQRTLHAAKLQFENGDLSLRIES